MIETDHKSTIYGVKGIRILWALFSLFILYTTLVPFSPAADFQGVKSNISEISWIPFFDPDGSRASIPDIVQNVLLFLPFGCFGILASHPRRGLTQVLLVTVLGFLLSCSVEILQLFTRTRTTSATDVVTNTVGAFIGAALTVSILGSYLLLQHSSRFQKIRRDKYFALVVLSTIVVIAGALQPFDFSITLSQIWAKLKMIKSAAFSFDPVLRDEGVILLRMFLFGFVWRVWLSKSGRRHAAFNAFVFSLLIAVASEMAQLIVRARVPEFFDVVAIVTGCSMGIAFAGMKRYNVKSVVWSSSIISATFLSVAMQVLSPFQLTTTYTAFNWFPFLAYDERTTFVAISNFIESMLMFYPMGFILQYHNPKTKVSLFLIGVLTVMIAMPLEFLQGWITGRYPDLTDVLGALAGALSAGGLCLLWYYEFVWRHAVEKNPAK